MVGLGDELQQAFDHLAQFGIAYVDDSLSQPSTGDRTDLGYYDPGLLRQPLHYEG